MAYHLAKLLVPKAMGVGSKQFVMVCMWLPWVCTGEIAGTTGQSRRVEAIQIDVNPMLHKSVMYKVHLENIGWTD